MGVRHSAKHVVQQMTLAAPDQIFPDSEVGLKNLKEFTLNGRAL